MLPLAKIVDQRMVFCGFSYGMFRNVSECFNLIWLKILMSISIRIKMNLSKFVGNSHYVHGSSGFRNS